MIGNFSDQSKHYTAAYPYIANDVQSLQNAVEKFVYDFYSVKVIDSESWLNSNSWDHHVQTILKSISGK